MKVLIACEFSGIVRSAFETKGHQVASIDLLASEQPGTHVIADVANQLSSKWDMMVAFPPCTYLARSGARWYSGTVEQELALDFVSMLMCAPIKRICIENPIGAISSAIVKPSQIVQPWQFGHGETKATCLWLKNLPNLIPTHIVNGREQRIHYMPPSKTRWKDRSRTFTGIANAMANQWTE